MKMKKGMPSPGAGKQNRGQTVKLKLVRKQNNKKETDCKVKHSRNSIDLKKAGSRDGINYITFNEVYLEKRIVEPVIDGMLYQGDQTLIHGSGGVGKSLFVMILTLILAIGDYFKPPIFFLEKFQIHKGRKTLFLQSENSQANMHYRINEMCKGDRDLKEGLKNLFIFSKYNDVMITGETFTDDSFCSWLVEFIFRIETEKQIKLDLLVIDPLISFYGGDENDASKTRKVLDNISTVCQKTKISPIVIHHDNKSGKYRGSSAILDWARNMISLKEEKIEVNRKVGFDIRGQSGSKFIKTEVSAITVEHEKCNNYKKFEPFHLEINKDMTFQLITDAIVESEKQRQSEDVVEALKSMGGEAKSMNALQTAYCNMTNHSRTTARTHIIRAAKEGFVETKVNGSGKTTKAKEFRLPKAKKA